MALFKPAWMSKNTEKRMKAINKVTDRQQLLDIIVTSPYIDVTEAAFRQLRDTAVMVDMLLNHSNTIRAFSEQIPIELAQQLSDENTLYELVLKYSWIKEFTRIAMEKINDQLVLAKLVSEFKGGLWSSPNLAITVAVDKLLQSDNLSPEVVRYILINLDDSYYRSILLQKVDLSDVTQEVWKEVAENEALDASFRSDAIEHITDQDYLLRVAMDTDRINYRSGVEALACAAVKQLRTQQAILTVVLSDACSVAWKKAVSMLQDTEPMLQVILDKTTRVWESLRFAEAIVPTKRIPDNRVQEVIDAILEKTERDGRDEADKKNCLKSLALYVLSLESGQEKYGIIMHKHIQTDGDGIEYPEYEVSCNSSFRSI